MGMRDNVYRDLKPVLVGTSSTCASILRMFEQIPTKLEMDSILEGCYERSERVFTNTNEFDESVVGYGAGYVRSIILLGGSLDFSKYIAACDTLLESQTIDNVIAYRDAAKHCRSNLATALPASNSIRESVRSMIDLFEDEGFYIDPVLEDLNSYFAPQLESALKLVDMRVEEGVSLAREWIQWV